MGSLEITKFVEGPGNAWGTNQFRILVTCTLADASPSTVYDDDRFLDVTSQVWTIDNLPTGATCNVSEDPENDGGANFTLFTVGPRAVDGEPGVDVTIGDDTDPTPAVSVINLFGLGSIQVTKTVDGDTDELPAALDGAYTVNLSCSRVINGVPFDIDIPGGPTRVIQASGGTGTVTYDGLPSEAECRVSETASDPQAQEITVSPETITVGDDEEEPPVQVGVTNTFHLGSVTVTKDVTGPGADLYGSGPFQVSLACTDEIRGQRQSVPIPGGADRELSADNGLRTTYLQLPVGAECRLTEAAAGGATSTSISVSPQAADPVTTPGTGADLVVEDDTASSGDGTPAGVAVAVQNRFAVGAVRVTKRVTGSGAPGIDRTFTIRLDCTRQVDGTTIDVPPPGGATRSVSRSTTLVARWDDLPTGALCTVSEPRDGGADTTTISPSSQLKIGDGTTAQIRVVNRFDATQSPSDGGDASPPPATGGEGSDLPGTGSPVAPWMIWLAVALVAIGSALLGGARPLRRRK